MVYNGSVRLRLHIYDLIPLYVHIAILCFAVYPHTSFRTIPAILSIVCINDLSLISSSVHFNIAPLYFLVF